MHLINSILTALLGPVCEHGCGLRVYRKDRDEHLARCSQGAIR